MADQPSITPDSLIAQLDFLKAELHTILDQLNLDTPLAQPGDWTPRQILSHIVGSLHWVPVQAGYFAAGVAPVPVTYSDPYWNSMWADAPASAFKIALDAAAAGNTFVIHNLQPDVLWRTLPIFGFGEMPLAVFLMVNYKNHITDMHIPQLRNYL